MKKGDFVEIKENGKYSGQDMGWTEIMTSSEVTKSEFTVYHYSDKKLNEFRQKETCFFDEKIKIEGHVYELTIPAGTYIERFDNEIRVELESNLKIRYIGEIKFKRDFTEKGTYGNPYITVIDKTI